MPSVLSVTIGEAYLSGLATADYFANLATIRLTEEQHLRLADILGRPDHFASDTDILQWVPLQAFEQDGYVFAVSGYRQAIRMRFTKDSFNKKVLGVHDADETQIKG